MKRSGTKNKYKLCGCWDSSPGLHGHNVEFSPLNYRHFGVKFDALYFHKREIPRPMQWNMLVSDDSGDSKLVRGRECKWKPC